MRTLYFAMFASALFAATSAAQTPRWIAVPTAAPIGQEIVFTLQNRTTGTLYVRGSTPFMVQDSKKNMIFQPRGLPITMPVGPGNSLPFNWNQLDLNRQQVAPGLYEGVLDYATQPAGPLTRVTKVVQVTDVVLAASGNPTPGGQIVYALSSPLAATLPYQVALSFADLPAIQIPGGRRIDLRPDALLYTSLVVPTPLFVNFTGTLDANGKAVATLNLPNIPVLTGSRIYAAFVTLAAAAPGGIFSHSATTSVQVN